MYTGFRRSGLEDVGIPFAVFLGEPVRGALGGCGLQVEEVSGLLLKFDYLLTDVVEHLAGEGVAALVRDIEGVAREIADALVDAVHPDGEK